MAHTPHGAPASCCSCFYSAESGVAHVLTDTDLGRGSVEGEEARHHNMVPGSLHMTTNALQPNASRHFT